MTVLRMMAMGAWTAVLPWVATAQPTVSAVLNGASYNAAVAPGCWVAIFGTGLAAAAESASGILPGVLGGVRVTVGGLAAPLLYVSPGQINALIPAEVAIPSNTVVPLVVGGPGGESMPYPLRMTRDAPAIFTRDRTGTGRALVFDASFRELNSISRDDVAVLYATGLGPADATGKVIDAVEVYVGERPARVLSATLAPGFPGIYQLNIVAPAPATDRVYIRAGGWQSNIAEIGIRNGNNATNVSGDLEGLYPSSDPFFTMPPCVDEVATEPCGPGQTFSIMLHAASFHVSFDVAPGASPFDVAAVGPGGAALISIDPGAGSYTATISTLTPEAIAGDFSKSIVPLWDYTSCTLEAICFAFPGPSILPQSRLDPFWLQATRRLPAATTATSTSANGVLQTSGRITGGHMTIDAGTNASLATFGGIVQAPLGPFEKLSSTFRLYVDGRLVASKDVPYRVVSRAVK